MARPTVSGASHPIDADQAKVVLGGKFSRLKRPPLHELFATHIFFSQGEALWLPEQKEQIPMRFGAISLNC